MKDLLDYTEVKSKSTRFTNLALICGLSTLIGFVYMANLFSGTIKAIDLYKQPPLLLIRGTQLLCILGILFTLISIIKKEPWNWKKWISTILNSVLFVIIVGSICFAYFIELSR